MTSHPTWPRSDYDGRPLEPADLPADGLAAAGRWYHEALAWHAEQGGGAVHGNEAALATSTPSGRPSVRIVLVRGLDAEGLVFYTDRESRKGVELQANPHAALTLWWPGLARQVRFEGRADPVDDALSDAYHDARPRGSQLSAAASHQSHPVASREVLEARRRALDEGRPGASIPRPARWGGFRLVPDVVELWQGRPDRLHDRLRYERGTAGDWTVVRLQP